MLQVDLSSLRGPELRRLLDATRQRGQAAEAYEILREMAARREHGGRRSDEHHEIAINLGDPLERQEEEDEGVRLLSPPDMPRMADAEPPPPKGRRAKAAPAAPLAKALLAEAFLREEPLAEGPLPEEPLAEEHAPFDLRIDRAPPPEPPSRRRWPGAGFAAGILVGALLGWSMAGLVRARLPSPVASVAAARPMAPVAEAASALPPAVASAAPTAAEPAPAPTPETSADSVAAPAQPDQREAAAAAPQPVAPTDTADTAQVADATPIAPAGPKGCAAQPTPADQTICKEPRLQRLQRELRQAYAEALDAHEDRTLLREHQLAWREARNPVGDPDRLARLYEERIRKLNAATAAAHEHR